MAELHRDQGEGRKAEAQTLRVRDFEWKTGQEVLGGATDTKREG